MNFDLARASLKLLAELNIETWFENESTSTNRIAKEEASQITAPCKVYLTNHQSAGRGRNQNSWQDLGAGQCFLSSWSFSFVKNPQPILAPLVGLALYKNLSQHFLNDKNLQLNFSLKAPNDILIGKDKLCGILIENILAGREGRCVIGIGLNVFDSPQNLGATHLNLHTKVTEQNWSAFLKTLSRDLSLCLKSAESESLTEGTCLQLTQALNKNPHLSEELLAVSPNGSLIFKDKKIDWQSL